MHHLRLASTARVITAAATMEVLGEPNWWLPRWLGRVLPKVDIDGHHDPARQDEAREPVLTSAR